MQGACSHWSPFEALPTKGLSCSNALRIAIFDLTLYRQRVLRLRRYFSPSCRWTTIANTLNGSQCDFPWSGE